MFCSSGPVCRFRVQGDRVGGVFTYRRHPSQYPESHLRANQPLRPGLRLNSNRRRSVPHPRRNSPLSAVASALLFAGLFLRARREPGRDPARRLQSVRGIQPRSAVAGSRSLGQHPAPRGDPMAVPPRLPSRQLLSPCLEVTTSHAVDERK